ncbi:MAG: xanthine dehydrogenase family protein subunit M, partial [Halobacteriaceae archaeon]
MKPAPFEYHSPNSVEEATDLLAQHGSEAELMAGNQSLGIIMANRLATPDHVIDLNNLDELDYIDITDSYIEIGALTSHRTIERSEGLRDEFSIFPEAAEQIAGPVVRNRGTIGGSIGEADPAGNYPTVITALNADLNLVSPEGKRTITADEYFIAYM